MPHWIKLVALFLLVFTLFDVSTPEECVDDDAGGVPQTIQIAAKQSGSGPCCAFEEDCMACAHILPSTHFDLQVVNVVVSFEPYLLLVPQSFSPSVPYLPPRA
jgi:hypothetical protein